LQPDISFKTGSVIIDGIPYPDYDPTIGVPIGTIQTLETVNVNITAIKVKVLDDGFCEYKYSS